MTSILELHVSGLREGEAPTFRLQPIGPDTGPSAVYLDLREFLALSSISTQLSRETNPPHWH